MPIGEQMSMREKALKLARSVSTDPATSSTQTYTYFDQSGEYGWLYRTIFRIPAPTRFLLFCFLCVFINLTGLLFSQATPYSMFYLDTIGTAMAGLLGGVSGGLLVGCLSNLVGGHIIKSPDYGDFALCNMAAGALWAILPRYGNLFLGSDIFEPSKKDGYRKMIIGIFSIGSIVGTVTTIVSYFVQTSLLNLNVSDNSLNLNSSIYTSVVSVNNILMTAAFAGSFPIIDSVNNSGVYIFVASLVSNVPDKILSTSVAVILTVGFLRMPNFRAQILIIRQKPEKFREIWNRKLTGLMSLAVIIVYLTANVKNWHFHAMMFISIFSASVLFLLFFLRSSAKKVVDPLKYNYRHEIYYNPHNHAKNYPGFRKDAFEDCIKIILSVFVASQFFVSMAITNGVLPIILDTIDLQSSIQLNINGVSRQMKNFQMGTLLVFNVFFLQSLRYSILIFLRLIGKL
jgi:hypothetical protein